MKESRLIMGMPVSVEIVDVERVPTAAPIFARTFEYLESVDARFSTHKGDSEISHINRGEIAENAYSEEMHEIFSLAEHTKKETEGFFDIRRPDGALDPSGIVKG
ncbi:MAG: FAD:protein FMN transferase, partial [Minisyncoccia bacterium]